jgi:cytochrome P450
VPTRTSVPNGTFREIQYEETIHGPNNAPVKLTPGTQVWIPSWLLHRSEALWGKDVLEFNPDREWLPEESWFGKPFGATNPASHRFAPFTFPPRGCLGLNFAQMESRVILSKVFREFDLEFAEPTKSKAAFAQFPDHFLGENRGTMQPEGGLWVIATPRQRGKPSRL